MYPAWLVALIIAGVGFYFWRGAPWVLHHDGDVPVSRSFSIFGIFLMVLAVVIYFILEFTLPY